MTPCSVVVGRLELARALPQVDAQQEGVERLHLSPDPPQQPRGMHLVEVADGAAQQREEHRSIVPRQPEVPGDVGDAPA